MAAVRPISPVVRLPFGRWHFDQSRERRDGPLASFSAYPGKADIAGISLRTAFPRLKACRSAAEQAQGYSLTQFSLVLDNFWCRLKWKVGNGPLLHSRRAHLRRACRLR